MYRDIFLNISNRINDEIFSSGDKKFEMEVVETHVGEKSHEKCHQGVLLYWFNFVGAKCFSYERKTHRGSAT